MPTLTLTATLDATLDQGSPPINNGAAASFTVKNTSGFVKKRALVCFDLSSLPTDATITAATLQLYCKTTMVGSQPSQIMALMCDGGVAPEPVEAEVTWNDIFAATSWLTAGGGGDVDGGVTWPSFDPNTSTTPGLITPVDVKDELVYLLATYNHPEMVGFLIKQSSGTGRETDYATKEDGTKQAPTLVVNYTRPGAGMGLLDGGDSGVK